MAQVKYIGIPANSKDIYFGVQLAKAYGDTDGIFRGTRYFECQKKHRLFVKPKEIAKIGMLYNISHT